MTRDLCGVLTNVMNFWIDELNNIGVSPLPNHFTLNSPVIPPSRSEIEDGRMDMEIVKGLRFKQAFRIQKYNYETCEIEPVDLTGYEIKSQIYKPSYSVDLTFIDNKSGQEFKKTILLTEDESQVFAGLKNDEERQSFLEELAQDNGTIVDLVKGIKDQMKE